LTGRMEDRLAQVEVLVEQRCVLPRSWGGGALLGALQALRSCGGRWERARAKQRQNAALGRRKDALVREVKALVTTTRSVNEAEAAELEARILRMERQVEMRRREIASRRAEVARQRSRRLAVDAQIKQLKAVYVSASLVCVLDLGENMNAACKCRIASERKENAHFFGQVVSDKHALDEMDKQRREKKQVELEEQRRALLHEHRRVQEQVAAAQVRGGALELSLPAGLGD
jgi:hypothetical protein